MSGRQQKALRREGVVISIDERRRRHDFERAVAQRILQRTETRYERRTTRRQVLAWLALAAVVALIAFAVLG